MSKTRGRLLKLGPAENSTRVIDGIQAHWLFIALIVKVGARKRVDGLKRCAKSGCVAYRTREDK
jgi:hypothetical protein